MTLAITLPLKHQVNNHEQKNTFDVALMNIAGICFYCNLCYKDL